MKQHIYADNAATTKISQAAFEAMIPWLTEEYGNASQPYAFSRNTKKAIADARITIANCIGASPDEIYFTSGGTESDNWAIKGTMLDQPTGCKVITSAIEHHAVSHSCAFVGRLGYETEFLLPDTMGIIHPSYLAEHISENTKLVSIMLANNEIGSIQPIRELCTVAHQHGAIFHTDAVQAVGHIKIDVNELGVDMLSASAHKFNGPKGIGFLYIRKGVTPLSYADGGSQEHGYRAGTENVASIVGMATALHENVECLNKNIAHVSALEDQLLHELHEASIPFIRNGGTNTLPGLISLSFAGHNGEALLHRLDLAGISVSTGSACNSVSNVVSHVLQAIKLDDEYAKGTIRISLGHGNSPSDVSRIVSALQRMVKQTNQ